MQSVRQHLSLANGGRGWKRNANKQEAQARLACLPQPGVGISPWRTSMFLILGHKAILFERFRLFGLYFVRKSPCLLSQQSEVVSVRGKENSDAEEGLA